MRSESGRSRGRARWRSTISPSTTHRSGSAPRSGSTQLGEVARQRLLVAAPELDVVAVAEHDAAEAVPLRLVRASRRRSGSSRVELRQHRRDGRRDRERHARGSHRDERATSATGRRPLVLLAGRAVVALDDAPREPLRADDELHGHAEQVGVGELHPGAARRGRRSSTDDAGGAQLVVERVGRGRDRVGGVALARERDQVHVVRRERGGPHDAVLVVVLLDDRGDDARHADAVAAHHHRVLRRRRSSVYVRVERLGVLGAELEHVTDLDAAVDRAAARRSVGRGRRLTTSRGRPTGRRGSRGRARVRARGGRSRSRP